MAIKTAVIGVGALGQHHARILSSLEGCQLVSVVDANMDRAKEIAEKYNTSALQNYREIKNVDAVVVAAPTIYHREISNYFLERGVSVLCEKPLASSVEECDSIVETSQKYNSNLLVGHIEHFNPAVECVFKETQTPGFLEIHRLGVFTGRSLDVDVVYDLMIHDIEISSTLVKSKIENIEAIGVAVLSNHIDIANARITYESGCVCNLTASRISKDKIRKLRLFEKNSYFSIDYSEQSVEAYRIIEENGNKTIKKLEFNVEKKEPLRAELEHFIKVVKGEEKPKVDGISARNAVKVAAEIVEKILR
ncbi:MAG: Gfo/Idh/MocA family oxidoreductase, partial [Thermoanaerobaculaceae bacterium]|nr:Gfo/Idh/MocA family oxidoreductase [Thermoanaerobaculaceae bacterium]